MLQDHVSGSSDAHVPLEEHLRAESKKRRRRVRRNQKLQMRLHEQNGCEPKDGISGWFASAGTSFSLGLRSRELSCLACRMCEAGSGSIEMGQWQEINVVDFLRQRWNKIRAAGRKVGSLDAAASLYWPAKTTNEKRYTRCEGTA